ncbi:MAG: hypothetical protein ACI93R_000943 [Flavobacteriales bacterium]|jgi:hypothetical protein
MAANEYYWGWILYVFGASIVYAVGWRWTYKLPWRELASVLRIIAAVILYLPWYTNGEGGELSPAWMICFGDAFTRGADVAWKSAIVILSAMSIALTVATLTYLGLWYKNKPVKKSSRA